MIRVVVTGSECTGKTTLARALADRYRCPWAPEYARSFVAAMGAAPEAGDVEAIARGQIAAEERAVAVADAAGSELVVLDTDLLSTVIYSRHYYGGCPDWVAAAAERRAGDLYLLAGIDVPWAADPGQRDRGDRREEMQALFRAALDDRGLDWVGIEGDPQHRLAAAVRAVDRRIAAARR